MTQQLPSVEPAKLGKHDARVNSAEPLDSSQAKFVQLQALKWTDEDGKDRKWESAARKTRSEAGVDAVSIAAILKRKGMPDLIPIILQYRPPVRSICVELPAGLVDPGEGTEKTALRELHEETGYGGDEYKDRITILEVGDVIVSDPGMSEANMQIVTCQVELQEGEKAPEPKLDQGELFHFALRHAVPSVRLREESEVVEGLDATLKLVTSARADTWWRR